MTVNWAGLMMLINPPQLQISLELLFRAGWPPMRTVGWPGVQGATVAGMQGMGVKTPRAAAVAAATVGLAGEEHIPKLARLRKGLLSMMLAAGVPARTLAAGSTVSGQGARPKLH